MNISAPLGRRSGDPGLYKEVVKRLCSLASSRWSAEGLEGFLEVGFKVGLVVSADSDAVQEHGLAKMDVAILSWFRKMRFLLALKRERSNGRWSGCIGYILFVSRE